MRWGVVLLLVTGTLLGARPASAKTVEEEVEELSNDAITAYKAGRYQLAVEDLTRAYAIRPLTALLYNLAKAYDKLNDPDKAYEFYKRYVESGEAEPKLDEKARARMAIYEPQLKAKKEQDLKAQQMRVEPEKPKGPTPEEIAAKEAEDRQHAKTVNLAIGITIAAVGLGAMGAGIGLYSSASGLHDQYLATFDETMKRQLKSDAQSRGVVSSIMYGVGGVALLGSLWFFYAALVRPSLQERDKAPAKVTLAPWLGRDLAGAGASWAF